VSREATLDAFINAYSLLGYVCCNDGLVEVGFQKIAIYVNSSGKPTHASRQLPTGNWTSKLGPSNDIEHHIDGVNGQIYGTIAKFMKKPVVVQ
jgi:hypothetical protein